MTEERTIVKWWWGDIRHEVLSFAEKHPELRDPKWRIVAIPRGGLVPAALLSHALDVQQIHFAHRIAIPNVYDVDGLDFSSPDPILLVDDIYDSGETLDLLKERLESCASEGTRILGYTIFQRRAWWGFSSIQLAEKDFLGRKIWIHFPWELDNDEGSP